MFTTAKHVCLSFDSRLESKRTTLWRLMLVTKSMFDWDLCALIDVEMRLNFVTFCHDLAVKGYTSGDGKAWKMSIFLD
jgi:hypothetical protein